MTENPVGVVDNYYVKIGVAAVSVISGSIKKGDRLKYKGHTTDFTQTVLQMEIEKQAVEEARAGDLVGLKVDQRVRKNDKVYKVD